MLQPVERIHVEMEDDAVHRLQIRGEGNQPAIFVQHHAHRDNERLDLLLHRRVMRCFKNQLERHRRNLRRRGEDSFVSIVNNSVFRREAIDCAYPLRYETTPFLLSMPLLERPRLPSPPPQQSMSPLLA